MPCGSPWRGQPSLPKIGLCWKSSALLSPWMLQCDRAEDIYNKKKMALFPSLISSSQSNTKLTLIENKKEKVSKQSWSLWLRFRAQGNLKAWNVELERIWCVSNWTEGDTVSGVCTFRHYLSNVLWHVWGIGGKGIEMRDLCRRHCSFISPLQSECTLRRGKKQADIQVDSDHTGYVFELSGYSL